jgi:Cu(I)/Ag(I) efflux system periplasmic protein CusF
MKRTIACSLLIASFFVAPLARAHSRGAGGMDMKGMEMRSEKAQTHAGSGTVSKVDAQKGAVTIAHAPIGSMNWPAMTMTFKVKEKKMLDKVKQGDKVQFDFQNRGKDHVITAIK